jgi:MoaA/NifB/PqqE/SkfB family radical SAM enzyme
MNKLYIQEPFSGGMLLSYKCTTGCKHCMYACSPEWKADWISENDAERILTNLARRIKASPNGPDRIGINHGLHFTGGEPFLNFDLLLKLVRKAHEFGIPSTFAETNCFWCTDDKTTKEKFMHLKDAGLKGILISVNPFITEKVPFERTERAIKVSKEVFGKSVIVYQEFFYDRFKKLGITGILSFQEYLNRTGDSLRHIELLPMGRAVYTLSYLYKRLPARKFFGASCAVELTRPWHVHIDNYCNYMTGYCSGISLGNARNLDLLCKGIDLDEYPILEALVDDIRRLYEIGIQEFGYKEHEEGYISKCHLCVDIRRHIAQQTDRFKELKPREFYLHLE